MIRVLLARLRQGLRTLAFPPAQPALPERFRGRPTLERARCATLTQGCEVEGTAGALHHEAGQLPLIDLGASLFCPEEAQACPRGALQIEDQLP